MLPTIGRNKQHDRVLRDHERERGALQSAAHHIFDNPVRARLVPHLQDYTCLGCCVAGYPELDVRAADYWERFWRIQTRTRHAAPARGKKIDFPSPTPPPTLPAP